MTHWTPALKAFCKAVSVPGTVPLGHRSSLFEAKFKADLNLGVYGAVVCLSGVSSECMERQLSLREDRVCMCVSLFPSVLHMSDVCVCVHLT